MSKVKIKKEEILINFYQEHETIDNVQLIWLQNELRIAQKLTNEANAKDLLIARLARKIECLETKISFLEIESKYVLDERV